MKPTRIDYIEISVTDVEKSKRFYSDAFSWTFEDYGPDYASFDCGNLKGGLAKAGNIPRGGVLVVLYAEDLAGMEKRLAAAGGKITRAAFAFPGGRRFHFSDPSGNELAVWSER